MPRKRIETIVRGFALNGGRLLLCRAQAGYFYLPGGHIEFGESATDALIREFAEETGLPISVGPLLLTTEARFTQDGTDRHELNLMFHVEHAGPWPDTVPSREDDIGFEWVDLAAVVDLDLRPTSVRAWIASGGRTPTGAVGPLGLDPAPWISESG